MKRAACIVLAGIALLLAASPPAQAHFRGSVYIGPAWGPAWWGPAFSYPYYAPPPVVIRQEPQEYIQPAPQPEQHYWYYCPDPQGYYPYVGKCPTGWIKVEPKPAPPETEE